MHIRQFIIGMFVFLAAAGVQPVQAGQGMWPLYDLDKLPFDSMKAQGLMLDRTQIYDPQGMGLSNAVVNLSGGTASFLSADGLLVTNHHVAFGAIQKQSTIQQNFILDGFYAPTRDKEIPALGYEVNVILDTKDVTARVLKGIGDEMTGRKRHDAIESATKRIIREAEKGREVKCRVVSMFGGSQYILYTFFRIRDIRLVYAPPDAIGNFGGSIDNWMWPRHVGDFSFLRAYVGPDGKPADYSTANVPYHPKVWLPVSSAGVKEGDFTMMMGFPGVTHRYTYASNIEDLFEYYYPQSVRVYHDCLEIMDEESAKDSAVAIRLESRMTGMDNYYKKYGGIMKGYRQSDILGQKWAEEKELTQFIDSRPELAKKFGHVLPALDSLTQAKSKTREKDFFMGWFAYVPQVMNNARKIYKWSVEREKKDIDREEGYQDRDSLQIRKGLEDLQINLVPAADKRLLRYFMVTALDLPAGQKIEAIEKICAGQSRTEREMALDQYLDMLYSKTNLTETKQRLAALGMKKSDLEKSDDPFMKLAVALMPEFDEYEARTKQAAGESDRLEPLLMQAYREWKNGNMYPDANGTQRFNYGAVAGYAPRDAITYRYMTSLTGVMEKETGVYPFIVPAELKQAYADKNFGRYADPVLGDMPVNFVTSNSGTNGSSGSPVINGKGELIGLDFDTDYEGVSADYMYNSQLARAIVVDTRYILFLLENVYHLDGLLKELTIH
ncbi:MAG: S46 family peptidase [candidate division Zixibacteria bacterium]|nr:S46 family peptidase [candidate division Zixibacteria bacterium]